MEPKSEVREIWASLFVPNEHLQIPLIYVLVPLSAIALVLLICCCFFCIKACCDEEPEILFVPSFVPSVRPRQHVRREMDDETDAAASGSVRDIDVINSETCVELDESTVDKVNAVYKKRNYQMAE